MMRNTNKLFNGEIDGYECAIYCFVAFSDHYAVRLILTQDQLIRIRSVFNDLKDGRNVLNFQKIIDLLGHYAPDAVLKDALSCDQLIKYFSQSPEATNMSTWLLSSRLTLASSVLNLPSKSHIMSLSTGSLFKFFDINNDGYIDEMEFYRGLAFLPHANEADSIRRVFQMFSSRSQAEVTFNSNDADFILRHFVPSRIRKETSCKISDIYVKAELLSLVNAYRFWIASPFLGVGDKHVFTAKEVRFVFRLWLHYVIVQQSKQGSQWFVVSSKYWPSLAAQGIKAVRLYLTHPRDFIEFKPKTKTPKESVGMNATTQNTHIAVDRRLAERMQGWSGINTNGIGISDNGQLMPSYLVLYTLAYNASKEEVLEMHPLEIGVRWTAGSKPKVSPTVGVITDTGVPKNPQFCEYPFTPAYSGIDAIAIPSGKKSSIMKRLVSSNEKPRLDPEQSLRFVFSRCHTVSEVCEAISKKFGDYRNRDLTPDNYRVWFIKASEPVVASRQRPKLSQITKNGGSSSSNSTVNNDEKDSGSPNNNLLAKQTCLVPVDLKAIGNHQLSRFLADQDPLAQHYTELFDPYEKCSRKFEFVVECLYQFYFWPLGQCPSKAPDHTVSYITNKVTVAVGFYPLSCHRLANEYKKLLDQMAIESLVNPRSLWHTFVQKAPTFSSFVQQDAHEFLIIFLDLLNEELKRKNSSSKVRALNPHDRRKKSIINKCVTAEKAWRTFCAENDSPITDVFYGLCESRCRFEGCCHKSLSFDPFASLTLPLPNDEDHFIILTVVPSYKAVPEVIRLESVYPITLNFILWEVSRRYKCSSNQVFLALNNNKVLTID
ncbi:Ubiquitin hydrolase [Echinococcus granulosus]|uniref:ubiquitinyl hydrolase 1 n=1 Tax=Echinococcus granulosus TaxID=6210 RepID=W6UAV1_ECHGR|nr:Ubiquitin hydrolase [Echinococcus granulosus]EUB58210.1 Ubiquitin hydrolase [Echinococcus granulosus]